MFITFEGNEGSGKSTIIKLLEDKLKKSNIKYILTREPGGYNVSIAEDIRSILLNKKNNQMTDVTEALLFAAGRYQHITQLIKPAQEDNKLIICDRYLDSSIAYQGYARNLGIDYILNINKHALDVLPDLTIYLDIDPKIGLHRVSKRSFKQDRLDSENMEFYKRVSDGYNKIFEIFKNRKIVRIDASENIDVVLNNVILTIEANCGLRII